jgi:hypothetical protein
MCIACACASRFTIFTLEIYPVSIICRSFVSVVVSICISHILLILHIEIIVLHKLLYTSSVSRNSVNCSTDTWLFPKRWRNSCFWRVTSNESEVTVNIHWSISVYLSVCVSMCLFGNTFPHFSTDPLQTGRKHSWTT